MFLYRAKLQHIHHGQPYARVDFIPQSGTLDLASGKQTRYIPLYNNLSMVFAVGAE